MPPRDPTRRPRILSAARAALAESGFRALRTDDVARAAGVSKGALFLDFPTRDALLVAVVSEILGASRDRWLAEVATLPHPLLRLRETLAFVFRERAREPVFDRLLREDPELTMLSRWYGQDAQQQQGDAEVALLRAWIDEGVTDGTVRADLPADVLPFVLSLLRFTHDHVALATHGRVARDPLLTTLVDVFASGIATEAGRALLTAEVSR